MSEKWFGFMGKELRINLTGGKISEKPLNREFARKFLGGVGYAAKVLWDELKPKIDPLSPENKLVFTTGPLTGTLCPGSGSFEVCFKSPLTNVWGESRCGGGWGPELKYAGFDIIVIEGRSEKPVYIWVQDREAEIRPADHLTGKNVYETDRVLREEVGDYEAQIVSIGIAGEKLVRFACIMSGDRAAGRCGGGAVMGSKNLKAIVVRGRGEVPVADPEAFTKAINETERAVLEHPERSSFLGGTIEYLPSINMLGDLPTKYGSSNYWDKAEDIYKLVKNYEIKSSTCFGCMIGCGRYSQVKGGKWSTPVTGGPEYETTASFTAFPLNENVEATIQANYLCNTYGMDTISCGHIIAFAMECYERGWIAKESLDGVELTWGNADAIVSMVEKIAKREGFGDILAEGVKRSAEIIGRGAPDFALHVKGLEMPYHDPRVAKNFALQYGTANRGMCHIHPHETCDVVHAELFALTLVPYGLPKPPIDGYSETGQARITKIVQDAGVATDVLGVCKFHVWTALTLETLSAITSAAIGWNISDLYLLEVGERVINLQRCFNIREGIRRKDDIIPQRIREVPAFGPFSRKKETAIINYETMLDEYYETRGWDRETGIPTRNKLKELELEEIANQL